jgi:cyclopropane-fatty-acyl-phospholipid synthase
MTLLASQTSIADAFTHLLIGEIPFRFTAYDGSSAGPADAAYGLHLKNERGLSYILSAPGDLGLSRAYVANDLDVIGAHPGDPFDALMAIKGGASGLKFRVPSPTEAVALLRAFGLSTLKPPPVPPQEHLPRWRRVMEGFLHSPERDAEVISHHYDVSNRFYEMVLGPSMTYTCACFPTEDATLEEAQFAKYDLVARKLGLQPACGCSTSAAGGAAWSVTPPSTTASRRSA